MGFFNKKELLKIEELEHELSELKAEQERLGITEYKIAKEKINNEQKKFDDYITSKQNEKQTLEQQIDANNTKLKSLLFDIENDERSYDDLEKKVEFQTDKLQRIKELIKAMQNGFKYDSIDASYLKIADEMAPIVTMHLNCLDNKELRKKFRENEKNIKEVLDKYSSRYTTKSNQTIYKLMVIAMQAELQNILSEMKYDKLVVAETQVKDMCSKYLVITNDGSQSIAPTIKKFIGEIEYLYLNAVKIEYEYYVKKEREKQEQAAIREQMRQEAEERRELERQKKQVEKEESKFSTEIDNVRIQISESSDDKTIDQLNKKIEELQLKLKKVKDRKEDIVNRQNGKAGNVYIISNIGSFGKNVFKVGMTRRLEPLDRVNELGDASVPFKFDVHAMIFSEDAVSLENKLHQILDSKRMNKVNLRKEFFKVSLDEMELIVEQEDPTADFKRTVLALEYNQTISMEDEQNYEA